MVNQCLTERIPQHKASHLIRGGKRYLEKRRSRKILAGSRNLGSVFDKARSLVFSWFVFTFFESRNISPKCLGLGFLTRILASRRVSDFTIRHPSDWHIPWSLTIVNVNVAAKHSIKNLWIHKETWNIIGTDLQLRSKDTAEKTKLSFFHHVHGNSWSCWFIFFLITKCYLQNWFDVKIVWNCCNSLYQF